MLGPSPFSGEDDLWKMLHLAGAGQEKEPGGAVAAPWDCYSPAASS